MGISLLIGLVVYWTFFRDPYVKDLEQIMGRLDKGQLSEEGLRIKEEITAHLQGKGGSLVQSPDFEIGYLTPPIEQFNIIIMSENEKIAEDTAIAWLKSRGFSEVDICDMPTTISFANQKSAGRPDRLPEICK